MAGLIHPLTGADLGTLTKLLRRHGWPAPSRRLAMAGMLGSALGRLPSTAVERAYVAARRPGCGMPAPIFILGHWRSGTTHLFNLLSGAPGLAYATPIPTGLPWDFLLLGRLLRPLLERAIPRERGIDAMAVTPTAPQEDEIALASMTAPSFFHGVYFPQRFRAEMARGLFFDGCAADEVARWRRGLRLFTEKVSMAGGGARVLIKNPAHTAKVAQLRTIWPDARFVHIVRDPHHVYQSTRRMFADMLEMLALQPYDMAEVEAAILETYPRMMDAIAGVRDQLPAGQFVELRYEDLEHDPLGEVARVADRLELANRDSLLAAARSHLDSVAGYAKRTREVPPEVAATVEAHWGRQRAAWGYPQRAGNSAGASANGAAGP